MSFDLHFYTICFNNAYIVLFMFTTFRIQFFGGDPEGRILRVEDICSAKDAPAPQESVVFTRFIPDHAIPKYNGHVLVRAN